MECAAQAAERGVIVSPIRYPSVPLGQALLRLTAHADYSEDDIALIVDALGSPSLAMGSGEGNPPGTERGHDES